MINIYKNLKKSMICPICDGKLIFENEDHKAENEKYINILCMKCNKEGNIYFLAVSQLAYEISIDKEFSLFSTIGEDIEDIENIHYTNPPTTHVYSNTGNAPLITLDFYLDITPPYKQFVENFINKYKLLF